MDVILNITKSEKSDLKDVFEFFKRKTYKLPKSSKTPLGKFLAKSKEEKLENYSKFELLDLIDTHIRDFIIVDLENEIFEKFLTKNSPRFNPDEFKIDEPLKTTKSIKLSSKELAQKDTTNSSKSEQFDVSDYQFYIKAIEQEIKEMHNVYQRDVEKHDKELRKVLSEQKSHELHIEKITKTRETFETFVIKYKNNKTVINPTHFSEFFQIALKQDKDDIRKMKVMLYEVEGHCIELKKMYKEKPRHRVDLEIKAIKSELIKKKITDSDEEFWDIKNILDRYNKEIDEKSKILKEKNNILIKLQKELHGIRKDIQNYESRKNVLEKNLNYCQEQNKNPGFDYQDFWTIGEPVPDDLFYAAGKLSCANTLRQINMYKRTLHIQNSLIETFREKELDD